MSKLVSHFQTKFDFLLGASDAGSLFIKKFQSCIESNDNSGALELLKNNNGKTKLDHNESEQLLVIIIINVLPKLKNGDYDDGSINEDLQIFIYGLTFGLRELVGGVIGAVTGLGSGVGGLVGGLVKGLKDGINGGLSDGNLLEGLVEGILQAVNQGGNGLAKNTANGFLGGLTSVVKP